MPAWIVGRIMVHEKPILCECGCREPVMYARQTIKKYGHIKGQPFRFKGGHQRRLLPNKSYPAMRHPEKPRGVKSVHLFRAEAALGHALPKGAMVHHVDQDPWNPDARLVVCPHQGYHRLLHIRTRVVKAGGNPNTQRLCSRCGQLKVIDEFVRDTKQYCEVKSYCKDCFNDYRRLTYLALGPSPGRC